MKYAVLVLTSIGKINKKQTALTILKHADTLDGLQDTIDELENSVVTYSVVKIMDIGE